MRTIFQLAMYTNASMITKGTTMFKRLLEEMYHYCIQFEKEAVITILPVKASSLLEENMEQIRLLREAHILMLLTE